MGEQKSTGQLAEEIRHIYQSDSSRAEALIEAHLENKLTSLSPGGRLEMLEKLKDAFNRDLSDTSGSMEIEEDVLSKVSSLLLGRDISQSDLSSAEILDNLADSLNTVFNALNQLIGVINLTLFAENSGDETIRYVIGSQLEGGSQAKSLESYLGQIQKAFLTTQQAFKNAAHARVKEILDELDPDKISESGGGGLKFGPLRKAECFEIYEGKFRSFKKWFESGRFMEAFLQEFEKNCQKLSE